MVCPDISVNILNGCVCGGVLDEINIGISRLGKAGGPSPIWGGAHLITSRPI